MATETPATKKTSKSGYRSCICQSYERAVIDESKVRPEEHSQDPSEYYSFIGTGCRKNVSGKANFAPGHDAKLKSLLILALKEGNEVARIDGGVLIWGDPISFSSEYGFGDMVKAAAARIATQTTKSEAPKVIEGVIKVGRWDYPARSSQGVVTRNTKRDGSGEWVAVADGKGFRNS